MSDVSYLHLDGDDSSLHHYYPTGRGLKGIEVIDILHYRSRLATATTSIRLRHFHVMVTTRVRQPAHVRR